MCISARALTQVLQHYFSWNNVALIYDKQTPYEALASALRERADDAGLTIKSSHYVTYETNKADIRSILMQMKKYTRGEMICSLLLVSDFYFVFPFSSFCLLVSGFFSCKTLQLLFPCFQEASSILLAQTKNQ